ncbi:hypothetical protein XENOCAPTIV_020105 [Xenoophorus captivus]|uniref:Uncharacterized protein n=1 Tax=Xenoophorus captivus TaxID=1517983 RepID=A0ABV0RI91_9TELE
MFPLRRTKPQNLLSDDGDVLLPHVPNLPGGSVIRWMEACLGEELPAPTVLEEALRNGVILAKLGHCFIPTAVPLKKIFDPEQLRYKTSTTRRTCREPFTVSMLSENSVTNNVTVCSDEEINNMKLELDKYGIQMPAFNKIGGILANELSVDEAAGRSTLIGWELTGWSKGGAIDLTVVCH